MSGLIGIAIDLLVDDTDAKDISLSDYSQAAFGVDPSDSSEGCQGAESPAKSSIKCDDCSLRHTPFCYLDSTHCF